MIQTNNLAKVEREKKSNLAFPMILIKHKHSYKRLILLE